MEYLGPCQAYSYGKEIAIEAEATYQIGILICMPVGILIGIAERLILSVTAKKAGQAESSGVSLILYRGAFIRVISVIIVLVAGAVVLDETMFICLVVSYAVTRLAIMFSGLWNLPVCTKRPRKQQES